MGCLRLIKIQRTPKATVKYEDAKQEIRKRLCFLLPFSYPLRSLFYRIRLRLSSLYFYNPFSPGASPLSPSPTWKKGTEKQVGEGPVFILFAPLSRIKTGRQRVR